MNTLKIRHLQNKIMYPVQCAYHLYGLESCMQLHDSKGILEGLLSLQTNAVMNKTYFDKELIKNNEIKRKLLKFMSWLLKMKGFGYFDMLLTIPQNNPSMNTNASASDTKLLTSIFYPRPKSPTNAMRNMLRG